jgi:hypothetical protein
LARRLGIGGRGGVIVVVVTRRRIPLLLDPELAVRVADGLAGLVEAPFLDELLGVVFVRRVTRMCIPSSRG